VISHCHFVLMCDMFIHFYSSSNQAGFTTKPKHVAKLVCHKELFINEIALTELGDFSIQFR